MVTQKPKPKLTYEDYAKTPDDERWELIDGELIMSPSPKRKPTSGIPRLESALRMSYLARKINDLGQVYVRAFRCGVVRALTRFGLTCFSSPKNGLHISHRGQRAGRP